MELTQDILLPVLLAAIVANTLILLLVVVITRLNRRAGVGPTVRRSVLQGSMMSTSYVDRSGAPAWTADGGDIGGAAAAPSEEDRDLEDDEVDGAAAAAAADADLPSDEAEPDTEQGPGADTDLLPLSPSVDTLTGLPDQAAFTRLIVGEDLRVHRYHHPTTVVIFELGGLDRLIARLGPDAGDRVVPALADTMRRLARKADQVARLAPGRFAVLMPETDEVVAINYIERVRRACELWLESGAIALSLAAGWASTDGDPTLVEAQRLATERMYVELRREARRATDVQPG